MDYYMVEIFESSSMTFSSSWAAIIVRMAEIISKFSGSTNFDETFETWLEEHYETVLMNGQR